MKKYSLILLVLFFSGCSLWTNFTTYFNLYYNTLDLFNEAETLIKEQKRDLFATTELTIPGGANTNLNKVVEKCSKILQFASESDYVDDALLIIGKSFYYQKNYLKAIRKFQELLATQQESDMLLETELWIGKCQMKLREETKGLETLKSVRTKALAEGEDEIVKDSYVEEIVYYILTENNQLALTMLNEFLEVSDDDIINAEIVYQAGKLYLIEEDVQNAIIAFEKVFDYSPSYDIEQDANIQLGLALREGGEKERALEIFETMRGEDKYSQAFDIIDLETGITLFELGRVEEAVSQLTIVDTSYSNSTSSGTARYKMGEIYENSYNNYDSASSYYTKASASAITDEYKILALDKSKLFRKYAGLRVSIDTKDKQLFYFNNPDEFTKDSLVYVQDSLAYIADSLKNVDVSHLFRIPQDTTLTDTTKMDSTITDTSMINKAKADSILRYNFVQDSIRNSQTNVKRGDDRENRENTSTTTIIKPKLNRPIKPTIPPDSLKTLIAKDQLELGNLFLTELHRSDSAFYYYNNILTELPGTQYQARTLYALGTYYLTTNKKETADSLFNEIYENHKSETIVNAAANQLNKPLIDLDFDPAKELYANAELKLKDNDYEQSLSQFFNIYKSFPKSLLAPKALFASGWILENNLSKPDSAASIYDTIVVKYPTSVYASQVRPKLTFYKQEKDRIKRAIEDSLRLIQQQIADSIKADSLKHIISADSLGISADSSEIKTDSLMNVKSDTLKNTIPNLIEETESDSTETKSEELKQEEDSRGGKDDGREKQVMLGLMKEEYFLRSVNLPSRFLISNLRC